MEGRGKKPRGDAPPETLQATSLRPSVSEGTHDGVIAIFFPILGIVADIFTNYIGTAVKAGSAHVVLWLLGMVLFFLPLALVVIYLSRRLPLEGGLYEWARIAFNDQIGFLVAWNLCLYVILYVALGGLVTITFASYVIPGAEWIASSKLLMIGASFAVIAITMGIAGLGLRIGKWINNVGSVAFLITVAVLIVMPFVNLRHGTLHDYHPFRLVAPSLTLFTLSVFSKMTFGALTGFEYVAVLRENVATRNVICRARFRFRLRLS
jgi:glutamate:GABA antiporter